MNLAQMQFENPGAEQAPPRQLTQEEKLDLRRKVLRGEQLTLEESKAALAAVRQNQEFELTLEGMQPKKTRKKAAGKAMSDEDLDASLGSLGL